MTDRIPAIVLAQRISGGLLLFFGAACLTLWLLVMAYSVYDLVSYLGRMLPGARLIHYSYPFMAFVRQTVVFSLVLLVPAAGLGGLGGFKVAAARALSTGSPRARLMGVAAGVLDILMCGPTLLVGIGTLVVLLSPEPNAPPEA